MKRLAKFLLPMTLGFALALSFEGHFRFSPEAAVAARPATEVMPLNLFVELSEKVNPAVVNISTTQVIRGGIARGYGGPMPLPNDPFRQFFEDFMGPGGGMPMPEEKVQSLGSGFIIDSAGLIVTNYHVIENASDIQIQLTETSKKTYKAKVVGTDPRTDIALIKIKAGKKLTPVALGDSDKIEVGQWVAAFGNPFGHGHSMTKGIISAKDRDIELEQAYYPFIQTDASINPGNSGGPLVNTSGEVIGVNAAIDARGQGLGFAIPINVVKKLLPALETKGKIVRGYLGVGISGIDDRMVKQLHLKDDKGAMVLSISPGSPAERAGLQPYDVIVRYQGKDVDGSRELSNMVADTPVGDTATIGILRDGQPMTLKAQITTRADETASSESNEEGGPGEERGLHAPYNLGFSVANITPGLARQLDLEDAPAHSVVVVAVKPNSLAAQAGLEVGDVILDVNRKPVHTAKDAMKRLKRGGNTLRVLKGGQAMIIFMGS